MSKKNGKTNINFNADLLENIKDNINVRISIQFNTYFECIILNCMLFIIKVNVALFEKENGHYLSITNTSLSLCRVLEKTTSNPIVKLVLAELMKFSNLPTSCPMLKAS